MKLSVKLTINKKVIELTEEEAKSLAERLADMFNIKKEVVHHCHGHYQWWPHYPDWTWWGATTSDKWRSGDPLTGGTSIISETMSVSFSAQS